MKKNYLISFIIILLLEIVIFKTSGFGIPFIRFYIGDIFAVWALYLLLSFFTKLAISKKIFFVVLLATFIEVIQYVLSDYLLENSSMIINMFIGSTFDWIDILIYVIAGISIGLLDCYLNKVES